MREKEIGGQREKGGQGRVVDKTIEGYISLHDNTFSTAFCGTSGL